MVGSRTLDPDGRGERGGRNFSPDEKKDVTAVAENGSRVRETRDGGDAVNARGKL